MACTPLTVYPCVPISYSTAPIVYLKIPLVSGIIAAYTPSMMIGKMSIPNAFLVMFLSTEDDDELLPPPPLPLPILLTWLR